MQHFRIEREADGIAQLVFDKAGATVNTLSQEVLGELNEALDLLDREPPKGLVIRSGKDSGFIAGADVDEFGTITDEAGALAIVRRGWDTFERLAAVKYPTLALIRGFCLGGGLGGAMLVERIESSPPTRAALASPQGAERLGAGPAAL